MLLAHGGVAGALVEGAIALAVVAVLVAVWVRERRSGGDDPESSSSLSEDGRE